MNKKSNNIDKAGFAERLAKAMNKEGFPPLHKGRIQLLADLFNLSHGGAGKWLSGQTCPPLKKYPLIAEKLNVSTQWLQTGNGEMIREGYSPIAYSHSKQEVPLLESSEIDNVHAKSQQSVTSYVNIIGHGFALKLAGDAMSPRFPPGAIIIVDTGRVAKDGDFVLIQASAFPAPLFRQLLVVGTNKYLNAHNPRIDRLQLNAGDKIKGVVVEAILSFY